MTFLLLFSIVMSDQYTVHRQFSAPGQKVGEEYLQDPYAVAFGPKGELIVIDRSRSLAHIWNPDGSYMRNFGKEGEGPGELLNPTYLGASDKEIWIWDSRKRMSIFDRKGEFLRSFAMPSIDVEPVRFEITANGSALFCHTEFKGPLEVNTVFQIIDDKGVCLKTLSSVKNNMYLRPIGPANKTTIKAFSPGADIYIGPQGVFFGYGQEASITALSTASEVGDTLRFPIMTMPPNDREIELVKQMSFPLPDGQRVVLYDVPNLKFDFSSDKAYYTNFMVNKDRVAFFLNPIGGLKLVGCGHSFLSYQIFDRKTGKALQVGVLDFPEDSRVFVRQGKILAVISCKEDFCVQELKIPGF